MKAEDKALLKEVEAEQNRAWNRTTIAHIRKVRKIKKPSPMFPNTIEEACEEYLNICEEDGIKPSVAGLGFALGVSREILLQWVRGEVSVECADVVRYYFSMLEVFDETALKDNKTNAVAGIFLGKNNYNYKDQVEHKIVDDREVSNEEIERRYRQMHEIVNETPKKIEVKEAQIEKPQSEKENSDSGSDDEVPF